MIDASLVGQFLSYDPATGLMVWLPRDRRHFRNRQAHAAWNTKYAGTPALTARHGAGYRHGSLFGIHLLAHRAAWAIVHGTWPDAEIDHINGDRSDNRLLNLRAVTAAENRRNMRRDVRNKTGTTGVFEVKEGLWRAYISSVTGPRTIGHYPTRAQAIEARRTAETAEGYHPNHGKRGVTFNDPSTAEDAPAQQAGARAA